MPEPLSQRKHPWLFAALLLAGAFPAAAAADEVAVPVEARSGLSITVYGDGLAMIRESRAATLQSGTHRLTFPGISPAIVASSAVVEPAGGGTVVAIDYDFDLLSPEALLRRSLGRQILVVRNHPQTGEETVDPATLLSLSNGIVVRYRDRIETDPPGRLAFPTLPPDLPAQPTLAATLANLPAGRQELRLSYLSGGLGWSADYVLIDRGRRLDLAGRATVTNTAGVDYEGAALGLIAGSIHRVSEPSAPKRAMMMRSGADAMAAPAAAPPEPQREAFNDLHLYRFPQPVTLADRQTRQLTLLNAADIALERGYVSEASVQPYPVRGGEPRPSHPQIRLTFKAPEGEGRMPLPAGIARLYAADAQGALRLIGEDRIAATPAGEQVRLSPGEAFDLSVLRRQTDYLAAREPDKSVETGWRIDVRNAKDEAATVDLVEIIPGDWKILAESAPHTKETADRLVWRLEVPARGAASLTYRVRLQR